MYEIERILRERRHARHGYPIIRDLNESSKADIESLRDEKKRIKIDSQDWSAQEYAGAMEEFNDRVSRVVSKLPKALRDYYLKDDKIATVYLYPEDYEGIEVDENLSEASYDDDPEETNQEYTSAATSINSSKLPAIFKLVKFAEGSLNLDYGGGRFDNVAEYLEAEYNATNLVYDPYNRTAQHNQEVLSQVRANGGADTVTCSNVLNVIKEPEARATVIRNCKKYLKSGGTAYFTVYEGTGKGNEGPTKSGYQLNRKTATYVEEIEAIFSSVQRKGQLIIARG